MCFEVYLDSFRFLVPAKSVICPFDLHQFIVSIYFLLLLKPWNFRSSPSPLPRDYQFAFRMLNIIFWSQSLVITFSHNSLKLRCRMSDTINCACNIFPFSFCSFLFFIFIKVKLCGTYYTCLCFLLVSILLMVGGAFTWYRLIIFAFCCLYFEMSTIFFSWFLAEIHLMIFQLKICSFWVCSWFHHHISRVWCCKRWSPRMLWCKDSLIGRLNFCTCSHFTLDDSIW